MAGRKLFVGALPDNVSEATLRATFSQYGQVEDVFIKPNCEPGRQIAFVTMATAAEAQFVKESCDRTMVFPGCDRACEVMVARNQGLFGQPQESQVALSAPRYGSPPPSTAFGEAPRKIHVGSLPDGIQESQLRDEFSRYGEVVEIFVKQHCEPGRQWAFVTFRNHQDALLAKESCDRVLVFPGGTRACEVIMAKNQGVPGQAAAVPLSVAGVRGPIATAATITAAGTVAGRVQALPPDADGPRKILVGSLPDRIPEEVVRAAFSPYGEILDVYVKQNCEPGRQWAFVTFATHHQAHNAKISTDRTLVLAGGTRACEVMFARSEGREAAAPVAATQPAYYVTQPIPVTAGGAASQLSKIFVGSMPGDVTESQLREEFEKYGTVMDAFVKPNCEVGRQWGFVTYSTAEEAAIAKEATDRILLFPGADRACEVMIAKRKEPAGVQPVAGVAAVQYVYGAPPGPPTAMYNYPAGQPPPPSTPAPFDVHNTPWRLYYTKDGLPYYHHHQTGATQWDRPRDLPPLYGAAPVAGFHPPGRRGPY